MPNLLSYIQGIAKTAPKDKCSLELKGENCSSNLTNIVIPLKPVKDKPRYQVVSACDSCLHSLEHSDKCYLGKITNLKEQYPIAYLMSKNLTDINEGICLTIQGKQFNIANTPLKYGLAVLDDMGKQDNSYLSEIGSIMQKLENCDADNPKTVFTSSEEPIKEFTLSCSVHHPTVFNILDKREEELQQSLIVILS